MLFELLDLAVLEAFTPGIFSWMSQYFTFSARISFSPLSHDTKLRKLGSTPSSATFRLIES